MSRITWLSVLVLLAGCSGDEPESTNNAPTASAGPDVDVEVGQIVDLEGRGSDRDRDALTFEWSVVERPDGSTASPAEPDAAKTTITIDREGTYVLGLVVDDGQAKSARDTLTLRTINRPPVVNAGPDQAVEVGVRVTLAATAVDPEGDPMTFSWRLVSVPDVPALDPPDSLTPSFTTTSQGVYSLELIVTTPSATVRDTVDINSGTVNLPPIANAGSDVTIDLGQTATLDGSASVDPERAALTYVWTLVSQPNGSVAALSDTTTSTVQLTPDAEGEYVMRLVVNDGTHTSPPDEVRLTAQREQLPPLTDSFDPNEVYILGTVAPGSAGLNIFTHWSQPDRGVVGFDQYADPFRALISPATNRLLVTNTFEDAIREFHCDECELFDGTPRNYPSNVLANDPIIATPPCDPSEGVLAFRIAPDGAIIHRCTGAGPPGWFNASGTVIPSLGNEEVLALSADGLALTLDFGQWKVIDVATGTMAPVTGLASLSTLIAQRARSPGGFWLAVLDGDTEAYALYSVGADGVAQLAANYAPPPTGYTSTRVGQLDSNRNLFQMGRASATVHDVILRRAPDGPTDVVYTEATNPLVKLHSSGLVTGP